MTYNVMVCWFTRCAVLAALSRLQLKFVDYSRAVQGMSGVLSGRTLTTDAQPLNFLRICLISENAIFNLRKK